MRVAGLGAARGMSRESFFVTRLKPEAALRYELPCPSKSAEDPRIRTHYDA
jgi:hypothetical protein